MGNNIGEGGRKMNRLRMMVTSIILIVLLTACGDNNSEGANPDNDPINQDKTNNTTEDVNEDTMTNDEDFTNQINADNYQDYTSSKMDELNFNEISIDVSYGKDKEYEATIDQDRNEPIEAEVEDELNNEFLNGKDAFDYIFTRAETLDLTSNSSDEDVIDQILEAFDLPSDYVEFEVEITFNDGKELNVEDYKQ